MHRPRHVPPAPDRLARMPRRHPRGSRLPAAPPWVLSARAALAAMALVVLLAGCAAAPAASFDPTGTCTADGSAEGAYPELEALIPQQYHGADPERLDSGRNCTPENLGSLATAGIKEVRFAGGTWTFGEPAVVLATFTAPGL